uniref:Phg_2220_C domain-containing protein n=1 Tax=Parastrongyloides trichosuri TaxID=131310 RepID=A0A0N4ZS96_PARTI
MDIEELELCFKENEIFDSEIVTDEESEISEQSDGTKKIPILQIKYPSVYYKPLTFIKITYRKEGNKKSTKHTAFKYAGTDTADIFSPTTDIKKFDPDCNDYIIKEINYKDVILDNSDSDRVRSRKTVDAYLKDIYNKPCSSKAVTEFSGYYTKIKSSMPIDFGKGKFEVFQASEIAGNDKCIYSPKNLHEYKARYRKMRR